MNRDDPAPARGSPSALTQSRTPWHWLLPVVLFLALALPHLGQGDFNVDTGWYAALGLQSWRDAASGHVESLWSLPGIRAGNSPSPADALYANKPPLGFWINGLPLLVMGPDLGAARLGSVLAGLTCVLATVGFGTAAGGRRLGLVSGVVLAATWEFTRHTHAFSIDMWQAAFLTLGAWAAVASLRTGRGWVMGVGTGIAIGLALMTKPIVGGLALPLIAAWLVMIRRWDRLAWVAAALVVAVVVALPWHLSMRSLHGAAFTAQYFGREITERSSGSTGMKAGMNEGSESWWYYGRVLASAYWPWLISGVLAFVALARRGSRRAVLLCAVWVVGWLISMSLFPDKRPRYLLVVYPLWSVLSAWWLLHAAPSGVRACVRRLSGRAPAIAALAAVVGIALAVAPLKFHGKRDRQWDEFFAFLSAHADVPLWQGGFDGARSARVYLERGSWPIPPEKFLRPGMGHFIVYHRRGGLAPGVGEEKVFESGDLLVTRLMSGEWSPVEVARE